MSDSNTDCGYSKGELLKERVIEIAEKRVGLTEYPPNSNNIDANTAYYGKSVCGNFPWCCTEVWFNFYQAGADNIIPKVASCSAMLTWFENRGRIVRNPQRGDIVFFKWNKDNYKANHVGIVISVNNDGTITTIEGNTSFDEKGSQSNGGAVAKKTRKNGIVAYARPAYDNSPIEENPQINGYVIGDVYTFRYDMYVRDDANGKKKQMFQLTADGQKHAKKDNNGYVLLEAGTRVTCQDVKKVGDQIWIKYPSGWSCAVSRDNVYIR